MKILQELLGLFRPKRVMSVAEMIEAMPDDAKGNLEAHLMLEIQREERRQLAKMHEEGWAWQDYARKQDEAFSSR